MSSVSSVSPRGASTGVWLFGPAADLLFGCGLLYALLFAALTGFGDSLRAAQSAYLIPVLLVLVSLPHYGATLLRVYEQRSDRRRYALFTVWATLAVAAVFAASVYDAAIGSLLLTLYVTWSPWHYTGQNYGLTVMFLRRAGIAVEPALKRWLHASFVLSYVLVFLSFHESGGSGVPRFRAPLGAGGTLAFLPIGIPDGVVVPVFDAAGVAYLACLGVCAARLLRRAPAGRLLPAAMVVLSQALWFSVPIGLRLARVQTGAPLVELYSVGVGAWVALAHAAQYLWVTSYYARAAPGWHGPARYAGKVLVAGITVWTLPVLLFSPDLLGPASSLAAIAMLVASAVNVHHFILDGAIWKLRDGRISAVLLRSRPDSEGLAAASSWVRRAVWACASAWALLHTAGSIELAVRSAQDPSDPSSLHAAVSRLRWLGLDDADARFRLGVDAGMRGDLSAARQEFERSLLLQETGRGWVGLAHTEFHDGHPEQAQAALLHAVRVEPDDPETWLRASEVWSALGDEGRARDALARAASLAPERADIAARLRTLAASRP